MSNEDKNALFLFCTGNELVTNFVYLSFFIVFLWQVKTEN